MKRAASEGVTLTASQATSQGEMPRNQLLSHLTDYFSRRTLSPLNEVKLSVSALSFKKKVSIWHKITQNFLKIQLCSRSSCLPWQLMYSCKDPFPCQNSSQVTALKPARPNGRLNICVFYALLRTKEQL